MYLLTQHFPVSVHMWLFSSGLYRLTRGMCIIWWGGVVQAVVSSEDLGKEGMPDHKTTPHHVVVPYGG